MGLYDQIYESIERFLDEIIFDYPDIAECPEVVEMVAAHLKCGTKLSHWELTPSISAEIEKTDWIEEAKAFIEEYYRLASERSFV